MIRVCHVVLNLRTNGLAQCVANLCESLDRTRSASTVVCLDEIGTIGQQLASKGYPVSLLSRKGPLDISLVRRLVCHLEANAVDLLHSHNCMLYAMLAGKLWSRRPVVHTDHGRHFPYRENKAVVIEEFLSSRLIDRIVPVSCLLKKYLQEHLHFPAGKLQYIPNGVSTVTFSPAESREGALGIRRAIGVPSTAPLIGAVGRLAPVKNHALLVRAFALVLRDHPDCRLLIVGDGPEMTRLRELAASLGVSRHVVLTGERLDVPRILRALDVFVHASLSEGTSLAILEALATGLPVIASDVGDNSRLVIDGRTGFLFSTLDDGDLGRRISSLIANPELRNRLGAAGRRHVEANYSLDAMGLAYLTLYEGLLSR